MGALFKPRGGIVEPVWGWAKAVMGFSRWTFRGIENVATQWSVLCTAMNRADCTRIGPQANCALDDAGFQFWNGVN
jgi:hypothetical protein